MHYGSTHPERLDRDDDGIASLLRAKARGEKADFSPYLCSLDAGHLIEGTLCQSRVHYLALGPTGLPRVQDLLNFLANKIIDYAIPRSEINAAYCDFSTSQSSRRVAQLYQEARSAFVDSSTSGELGELLLWTLAESILKLPRLLCKMSLKTSSRVHFHGADGLHVGISDGRLNLYWGEAKLHADFGGATKSAISSLAGLMLNGEPNLFRRDLVLIQRHVDLDDDGLASLVLEHLNPDDAKFNQIEYRGLVLVGFDYNAYPSAPMGIRSDELQSQIESDVQSWRLAIGRKVADAALSRFNIEFFCIPFPSVDGLRTAFKNHLGI